MGADLGALLDHDDGFVRRKLLEPDRGGKAGRPGADNDGVEFHRLPGRKLRCVHGLLRVRLDKRHDFVHEIGAKTIDKDATHAGSASA